jgi:glutathione peroxidase
MRVALRSALPALLLSLGACASDSSDSSTGKPVSETKPAAPQTTTYSASGSSQSAAPAPESKTNPAAPAAVSTTTVHTAAAPKTEPAATSAPAQTTPPARAPQDNASQKKENAMTNAALPASFYGFKTTTLEGQPADLSAYKGKVVLVVNTASQCGLTPQYTGLEKLHTDLKAKGFSVLGFPSNDFGGQEPGTPTEIRSFCDTNYHVSFPLFGKVQTKDGEGQSPIYTWLKDQTNQLPRWNFGKYLIGKDGKVVQVFDSKVTPEDPALRAAIDKALGS